MHSRSLSPFPVPVYPVLPRISLYFSLQLSVCKHSSGLWGFQKSRMHIQPLAWIMTEASLTCDPFTLPMLPPSCWKEFLWDVLQNINLVFVTCPWHASLLRLISCISREPITIVSRKAKVGIFKSTSDSPPPVSLPDTCWQLSKEGSSEEHLVHWWVRGPRWVPGVSLTQLSLRSTLHLSHPVTSLGALHCCLLGNKPCVKSDDGCFIIGQMTCRKMRRACYF